MKTLYETLNEMKATLVTQEEVTKDEYDATESLLTEKLCDFVLGAELKCFLYDGTGKVITATGTAFNNIFLKIQFDTGRNSQFSLLHIINSKATKFIDTEKYEVFNLALEVHNLNTKLFNTFEENVRQQLREAEKKAEAERRAEVNYKKKKDKALKDFETLANTKTEISAVDDFYYALGWLAKHIGSMTAILPDYLGPAFEKYFGIEAPKTLVDSRAKTSGGYAKQWSWEFKCTLRNLKETVVPASIQTVTTDFSKGIHNTSFLWNLIQNYGFQFGKKQDIEKIRNTIPAQYISSFEEGLI